MTDAPLDLRYADWRATGDGAAFVEYVRERALRLRERGFRRYGIAALVETARYDHALVVGPDVDGLKINNSWRAFIARELMDAEPRLAGFFEVRRSVADALADGEWRMGKSGLPPLAATIATDIEDAVVGNIRESLYEQFPDKAQARDMLVRSLVTFHGVPLGPQPEVVFVRGLPPVTPDDVPVAERWRCVQPECSQEVTMASAPHLQPGLGAYKMGQCPNRDCYSNRKSGKLRGTSTFKPVLR